MMYFDKDFFEGKRVLNVGCGEDTFGTDFIDLYPRRPGVIKCDANIGLPYKDGTFDVVYSRSTFEHLHSPRKFLEEAKRVLKDNGLIIIITDNANYIGYVFNKTHHLGYEGRGTDDVHFALYTPGNLETYLKTCGFKVLSSGYITNDILSWRREGRHKYFLAKILGALSMVPNTYFKRMFSKLVYVVGQKK